MALSLPGSEFVGIDLAPTAIARGMEAIRAVALQNIRLEQGDITEVGDRLGTFDYVIAHGVYSWVPEAVRAALLGLIRTVMSADGLAFVSYNAEPGDHIRGILRGMMRMHTRHIEDPAKKIAQARALLGMLRLAPGPAGDAYRTLLQSEVGIALKHSDFLLYHDDLAEISQPFFFSEFMEAAHSAGLEFASEATFAAMSLASLPSELAAPLSELGRTDIIAKEQYLDFITCRGFRQTLLCHAEAPLDRAVTTERISQFRVVSASRRTEEDEAAPGLVGFRNANSSGLATDSPIAIAALDVLAARFPCSVPFDELAALSGANTPEDTETLAEVLFGAFSAGAAGFRLFEPQTTREVSERPVASPWARHRASSRRVVNLYHETLVLDEADGPLVTLLDGAHTVPELSAALGRNEGVVRDRLAEFANDAILIG
jgi:methyltransferase-like protein